MPSNVVDLIQKLLALSKSPNENEAAAAMSKAQELLIKYNLDIASVQMVSDSQGKADEIGMINEIVDFEHFESWQSRLLNAIAIRNFCRVIQISRSEFHILGRKTNVRSVETMYNWIEPQIIRLIRQSGYKRGDKTSYAYGIITTIGRQLDQSKERYQATNPTSRALIVNVQTEINSFFTQCYPHTTKVGRSTIHAGSYTAGMNDGSRVSVYGTNRQVSGSRLLLA